MGMGYIRKWLKDESGATAIEYGLVAAGVALAIAVTVFALGDTLYDMFFSRLPGALEGQG